MARLKSTILVCSNIPIDTKKKLKEIASIQKISLSKLISIAIDEYIENFTKRNMQKVFEERIKQTTESKITINPDIQDLKGQAATISCHLCHAIRNGKLNQYGNWVCSICDSSQITIIKKYNF